LELDDESEKTPGVEEEEEEEDDDNDEDDDLFDSDEEEEITQRFRNKESAVDDSFEATADSGHRSKVLGKRKAVAKLKRRRDSDSSNDDDFDDVDADENDQDMFEGQNTDFNLQSIKDNHRKTSNDPKGQSRFSKPKVFGSVSEYRKYLENQNREQELPPEKGDADKPDLQDFIKVTLRRDYLISLLGEPFFEKYVKGCYVKYSVGVDDDKPVYRLCQIIAIEEGPSAYKLPPNTINPQITNTTKKLVLHFGDMEKKNQRIDRVSNHTVIQDELDEYMNILDERAPQTDPSPVATKRDVRVIRNEQKKLRNYVYSHDEIKSMVKSKVGYNKLLTTEYSTAMESLYKKREEAQISNETEYLEAINKNIRLLEAENERQKKIFERTFKKQLEVNRRMKEGNVRRDMAAGMRKRQEDQEAIAKGVMSSAVLDPFIR
jgi:RNA polymerase-associated protein RTF1